MFSHDAVGHLDRQTGFIENTKIAAMY